MSKVMELVLSSTYDQQEVINRFNYLAVGTPAEDNAAAALVQAFGCIWDGTEYPTGLPFRDILNIQVAEVVYNFATCRDVYSDTDFVEVPFVNPAHGMAGSVGQDMSPFLAFGLRTNRTRLDIRRGTKRFVGMGEGQVDSMGAIQADALALLQTIADALSATLSQDLGGNSFTFAPVIAGKMKYLPPVDEYNAAGTAYKYWTTEDEQKAHLMSGIVWEAYTDQRTQNSRKVGHGR